MENKEKITQWKHFLLNYIWVTLINVIIGLLILFTIDGGMKWASLFPFAIAFIVVPIGNYVSWKKLKQ